MDLFTFIRFPLEEWKINKKKKKKLRGEIFFIIIKEKKR